MPKAAAKRSTQNADDPDTELLAMIGHHDKLWAQWQRLYEINEADNRIPRLSQACAELEPRILATPAFTASGLAGKRRVVERGGLEDDFGIVDTIFALDAERIAAAA